MKLELNIDDDWFKKIIETKVNQAIAQITEGVIQQKVDEILAKKFERINPEGIAARMIEPIVERQIGLEIERALGDYPYDREQRIKKMMSASITIMLTEALGTKK